MRNGKVFPAAVPVLAMSMVLVGMTGTVASAVTTNFSNFAGLGFAVGTTQSIAQDGIQLQVLQGMYEVTFFPEVNLKDFPGNGATREIQLSLQSGLNFDFVGFSIRDVSSNLLTVTSDRGGSFVVPASFQSYLFSGPSWQDLTWVRFTYTGVFTEAKMTSFTLSPVDVVPAQPTTWSAVKRLFE
jgi:hypothetical protein